MCMSTNDCGQNKDIQQILLRDDRNSNKYACIVQSNEIANESYSFRVILR